jgi:hypothetical protein
MFGKPLAKDDGTATNRKIDQSKRSADMSNMLSPLVGVNWFVLKGESHGKLEAFRLLKATVYLWL